MTPPRSRRVRELGINMTPMIDITFQLVIFFLVAYHWSQQEIDVALALPTAASGQEQLDNRTPRVTVNVLADGTLLMATEVVSREELARRLRIENAKEAGGLEVRIRADRSVPFKEIEPLLRTCADAGITNVTFAVLAEQ